jgi:protein-S-isoprenylcysteine O-methyltransferase Ste14
MSASGQVGFWLISFLWGWLVSLPHTLAAGVPLAERPPFGPWHIAGLAVFALGFALESTADWQKWIFKADPANAKRFCDVGVWRLSQHPNWAGNLLIWSGILLLNGPSLLAASGGATSLLGGRLVLPSRALALCRFGLASLSPLFLFALFSAQANGTPPLNKGFDLNLAKHGASEAFKAYDRITPRLLPTAKSVITWLRG